MARQQQFSARQLGGTPDKCPYACNDKDGNTGAIQYQTGCSGYSNCNTCIANTNPCGFGASSGSSTGSVSGMGMRKATGSSFKRRLKGGTGQPVQWRNAGGQIFGLTTQQALVAVAVGVAAYFIIQRVK